MGGAVRSLLDSMHPSCFSRYPWRWFHSLSSRNDLLRSERRPDLGHPVAREEDGPQSSFQAFPLTDSRWFCSPLLFGPSLDRYSPGASPNLFLNSRTKCDSSENPEVYMTCFMLRKDVSTSRRARSILWLLHHCPSGKPTSDLKRWLRREGERFTKPARIWINDAWLKRSSSSSRIFLMRRSIARTRSKFAGYRSVTVRGQAKS
jgi:hypothetical protein